MNFNTGLSALRASQYAINTVSQNLANANTPGYHRQQVNFQTRQPQFVDGQYIGTGVDIGSVNRIRDAILEGTLSNSISDLSGIQQQLSLEGQIETLLTPGENSVHRSLSSFFDEISRLSANPSEIVQRNAVVQQGVNIAKQTNDISNRLTDLKGNVRQEIDIQVKALNDEIAALIDLQTRIKTASVRGVPNDLYDQRDQLINSIAEKVDVHRYENSQDGFGLSIAGSSIAIGVAPIEFESVRQDDGSISIQIVESGRDIKLTSGSLSALTEMHNTTIDEYKSKIDEFASNLIRHVDQAHAKGVGINGPYSILRGNRSVSDPTVPLNESGIAFPVNAGELQFSVTNPQGEKRTYAVSVDPAVDSLQDLAAKIGSVGNVQAVIDGQSNTLSIIAEPGYRFDFTGNLETTPDLAGFSGSSTPRISGQYTGSTNLGISVAIIGSGTVGKTPGLTAQVTDDITGKVIAELNIGQGYEAGSGLAITDGVEIGFHGGSVVDGEGFTTSLIADSDSTGLLSALGINNFFTGTDASNIAVANHIVENPNELATSRSGDIADTTNLLELIGLRDAHTVDQGRLTFEDYLAETSSDIGFRVRSSTFVQENVSDLKFQYESEIASISGVDLNEEMVYLSQYQKSYEAAIQVIRTIETMLDELFAIIR